MTILPSFFYFNYHVRLYWYVLDALPRLRSFWSHLGTGYLERRTDLILDSGTFFRAKIYIHWVRRGPRDLEVPTEHR
jgi:hypothetical protein